MFNYGLEEIKALVDDKNEIISINLLKLNISIRDSFKILNTSLEKLCNIWNVDT